VIEMDSEVFLKAHGWRIWSRGVRGDWAGAIAATEQGLAAAPEHPLALGVAAWAYAGAGFKERAESIRSQLEQRARTRYVPPMALVYACASFATADTFFSLIDRAPEERDPLLRYLRVHPTIARFRSDPRYGALLEKIGLGD
jgi:hypothetical protein